MPAAGYFARQGNSHLRRRRFPRISVEGVGGPRG